MHQRSGLTLVEMMIIVVVIAIFASICIPAYSDYIKRSKIAEALVYADATKTTVSEYYLTKERMPSNNIQAGLLTDSMIQSTYVNGLTVTNGTITVTTSVPGVGNLGTGNNTTPNGGGGGKNLIVMTPTTNSTSVIWMCGNTASTTVERRYLPATCR
jgi:type IV pilus assembly protein PilA